MPETGIVALALSLVPARVHVVEVNDHRSAVRTTVNECERLGMGHHDHRWLPKHFKSTDCPAGYESRCAWDPRRSDHAYTACDRRRGLFRRRDDDEHFVAGRRKDLK